MILEDTEVISRLESPLNLMNQLSRLTAAKPNPMSLFVGSGENPISARTNLLLVGDRFNSAENETKTEIQSQPLSDDNLSELVDGAEKKIQLGIIKTKAADVLNSALDQLRIRLPEVNRVKDLSTIAKEMNSIVTEESDKKQNVNQQVIVYRPILNEISKYETVISHE